MSNASFLRVRYNNEDLSVAVRTRLVSDDLILFMHGFGCAKESFSEAFRQEQLKAFSICTFDFPGHGASPSADRSAYSMQAFADIANQLIDQLLPRRVYLICHSMGGAVGLIASQDRDDIGCYISIDGNLVAEDCGLVSRERAAQSPEYYTAVGYDAFIAGLQNSPRPDYAAWASWCVKADSTALHESAKSLVDWSDSGKLLDLFKSLSCKAYVHGDADDKQYVTSKLAQVPICEIRSSGHFMMIDNPRGLYATLADLLLQARAHYNAVADIPSL
jgi:pimeloyl-ACP methyl ester carboxylesterase